MVRRYVVQQRNGGWIANADSETPLTIYRNWHGVTHPESRHGLRSWKPKQDTAAYSFIIGRTPKVTFSNTKWEL